MKAFSLVSILVLGAATSACAHKAPSGADTTPTSSATPEPAESAAASEPESAEPAASAAPEPPKELTGCEKVLDDFDKTLAAASNECKKDSDCVCFPGALANARGSECGGVVDSAAGKKLATIAKQAKKDGCANSASCEPWTCAPICEAGRCEKGPRKKKK